MHNIKTGFYEHTSKKKSVCSMLLHGSDKPFNFT